MKNKQVKQMIISVYDTDIDLFENIKIRESQRYPDYVDYGFDEYLKDLGFRAISLTANQLKGN